MSRVRRGQFHEGFCSVYAPQSRLNIIPATRRPKSGHMNNQQPLSLFLLWGVMFFWGGGVVESPYITDHNDISVLLEIGHSRNCNTNSSQTKKKSLPSGRKSVPAANKPGRNNVGKGRVKWCRPACLRRAIVMVMMDDQQYPSWLSSQLNTIIFYIHHHTCIITKYKHLCIHVYIYTYERNYNGITLMDMCLCIYIYISWISCECDIYNYI